MSNVSVSMSSTVRITPRHILIQEFVLTMPCIVIVVVVVVVVVVGVGVVVVGVVVVVVVVVGVVSRPGRHNNYTQTNDPVKRN